MSSPANSVDSSGSVRLFTAFGGSPYQFDSRMNRYAGGVWHNHPEIIPVIQKIKSQSPNFKALMYRDLYCVLEKETPYQESAGGYETIPDSWFQKDLNGNRVEIPDYPGEWMMDLKNPDWQNYWIQKTLSDVKKNGWDGVMADDALTKINMHYLPPLQGYPDDKSLQVAVFNFLKKISEAFHAEGKLVIANASNTYDYPGLWNQWLDVTDGLAEEHFAGESWSWGKHVAGNQLRAVREAVKKGKMSFLTTYSQKNESQKVETSLAAYLVTAGDQTYWSSRPSSFEGLKPFEEDSLAWESISKFSIGKPVEEPRQNGSLWTRKFEKGFVAVNTGHKTKKIRIPGGQEITLKSLSGIILNDKNGLQGEHPGNKKGEQ